MTVTQHNINNVQCWGLTYPRILLRSVIPGPAIWPIGMLHLRRNFYSDQSGGGIHDGMYKPAGKFWRERTEDKQGSRDWFIVMWRAYQKLFMYFIHRDSEWNWYQWKCYLKGGARRFWADFAHPLGCKKPIQQRTWHSLICCKDLSIPSRWTVPLMYMFYLIIGYVNMYTRMVGLTGWTETTRCTTGGIGVLQCCQASLLSYASDIHTLLEIILKGSLTRDLLLFWKCPFSSNVYILYTKRGIFSLYVRYSTMLHLPPFRFHCVGGCWDRTQDCCDFGIDSQTL